MKYIYDIYLNGQLIGDSGDEIFDTKVCSECQYEYSYDTETGISNANFCPNCGAKMKGE